MPIPAYYNNPPAYIGYVGWVKIDNDLIRATSADVSLKQEILKPDVVDGFIDRSVYQIGPQEIDGSISFPALYSASQGVAENTWGKAISRLANGTLADFDVQIKYAVSDGMNVSNFNYTRCQVNTWQFAVTQSDVVNLTIDVMGLTRIDGTPGISSGDTTRIVTWADVDVAFTGGGNNPFTLLQRQVRGFEVNVNNNLERFYTLNNELYAQAIAPTKRDVTGNIVIMGRHPGLGINAELNEDEATASGGLTFGYHSVTGGDSFSKVIPNLVYQIEEMSLTNDLFETTVNWHALPGGIFGDTDPLA